MDNEAINTSHIEVNINGNDDQILLSSLRPSLLQKVIAK